MIKFNVRTVFVTVLFAYVGNTAFSQNVGINSSGAAPDGTAMLDIVATNKGLLIPRVALTATNAAGPITSPTASLLVYNTATAGTSPNNVVPGYYYWSGTAWIAFMGDGGKDWSLTGNAGTTAGTDFVGTTDNEDLVFKTNGTEYLRLNGESNSEIGFLGVNTNNPLQPLQVAGDAIIGGDASGYDNNSEFLKISGRSDTWTVGVQNEATQAASDFFIGLNDDTEDGIFHIENGGEVGIGTTTPGQQLEVANSGDVFTRINSTDNSDVGLDFYRPGTSNRDWRILNDNGTNLRFQTSLDLGVVAADDILILNSSSAQVKGYLLVGDPDEPTGLNQNDQTFYYVNFSSSVGWNVVTTYPGCETTVDWSYQTDHMRYTPDGAGRNKQYLNSPFIWLPHYVDVTQLQAKIDYESALENTFDGAYLLFDHDLDGTFTKQSTIATGTAYDGSVSGSTTTCTAYSASAWSGTIARETAVTGNLTNPTAASWVQFQIAGMEDGTTTTGNFMVYQFWLMGDDITYTSAGFEPGGIYAQGHIYAQSGSQIGDVAEFFPVHGETEPGDLISMDPKGTRLCYQTDNKMDELVLGVHSTDPSIFVNDPKEGTPIGLTGRVYVNVVNENGAIQPGDYLTASSVSGKAMKANEPCFVVGRALEHMSEEKGQILCILNQGWYNPTISSDPLTSGNYSLIPGKNTVKVIDQSISSNSKVFVTMRGNPGSAFWVTAVEDGYFEIELAEAAKESVNFDYLVNNAHLTESKDDDMDLVKGYIKDADATNLREDAGEEQMAWVILGNEGSPDAARIASLKPPSAPPDPSKKWTWDPFNGFKELNLPGNAPTQLSEEEKKQREEALRGDD